MGAHRVSWIIFRGKIPKGKHVLHKCDTPLCVNPKHLFIGTALDNIRDCFNKGRMGVQLYPELCKLRKRGNNGRYVRK